MMLILIIAAQIVPPPPIPVPPSAGQVALVAFQPGVVRCGSKVARPVFAPAPNLAQAWGGSPARFGLVTLRFEIADDGRPLSISEPERAPGMYFDTSDLAPTLAAWRFAPGARAGCTVTFSPDVQPVATAPIAAVHRAFALPHSTGPAEAAMRKRLMLESEQCFAPKPPVVRLRAYPDFGTIPQPPGTASYAMVGHDIDARGKPVRVRILSSDGNVSLDAAAVRAVSDSRFGPGARSGCSYPYHRRQAQPLVAPPAPDPADFRPAVANCDAKAPWALPPRMTYPEPFRRRAIEGWAVIGYDVAPWGATGKVTVLASEPAAAFGEAAKRIVQQAQRPPSTTGATGCVDRVVFKLPESTPEAPPE